VRGNKRIVEWRIVRVDKKMTQYSYAASYNEKGKYQSYADKPAIFRTRTKTERERERTTYLDMFEECSKGPKNGGFGKYEGVDRFWYDNGKHHREKGPAVICDMNDIKLRWYIKGKKHRNDDDGPAYVNYSMRKDEEWEMRWYIKGLKHREDGPAIIKSDGTMEWYENGELTKSKKNFGLNKDENNKKKYNKYFDMVEYEIDWLNGTRDI
jgi:hypothetical protein